MISVTILDDTVPELSKTVVVRLTNPQGGANLRNETATIVILENDYIAGVISLNTTSVLAREGNFSPFRMCLHTLTFLHSDALQPFSADKNFDSSELKAYFDGKIFLIQSIGFVHERAEF